ncbi:hypothetical protein D9M68_951630 [compost metagenome]
MPAGPSSTASTLRRSADMTMLMIEEAPMSDVDFRISPYREWVVSRSAVAMLTDCPLGSSFDRLSQSVRCAAILRKMTNR